MVGTGRFDEPNGCSAASPRKLFLGAPLRSAHLPWGARGRQFSTLVGLQTIQLWVNLMVGTGRFDEPNGCSAASPRKLFLGAPLRSAHLPWGARGRHFSTLVGLQTIQLWVNFLVGTGRFDGPNGCSAASPRKLFLGAPLRSAHLPWGARARHFSTLVGLQ